MNKVMPIALTVSGSEKAAGLLEVDMPSEIGDGVHRYQIIYVVRDGEEAEFRRDLGSSKLWKGKKYLCIPSLLEHTVDELVSLADELRDEMQIDLKDWLGLNDYKPQ